MISKHATILWIIKKCIAKILKSHIIYLTREPRAR